VKNIEDFGAVLARHPLVAPGWVQKLCYYARSAPCDEKDPEFIRIVELFRASNHSWNVLVKALMTSPLVTHAAPTQTTVAAGETVAIARRDHLCAALNARLGLDDACGQQRRRRGRGAPHRRGVAVGRVRPRRRGALAAQPADPVLPGRPGEPLRARGRPGDRRAGSSRIQRPPLVEQRSRHRHRRVRERGDGAAGERSARGTGARALGRALRLGQRATGITATQALQSTFVVACLSPSTVSIGL
jgi:hypothetical protein